MLQRFSITYFIVAATATIIARREQDEASANNNDEVKEKDSKDLELIRPFLLLSPSERERVVRPGPVFLLRSLCRHLDSLAALDRRLPLHDRSSSNCLPATRPRMSDR